MPTTVQVDQWFSSLQHPMRPVILRLRRMLKEVEPRLIEHIKWKSPTWSLNGNFASLRLDVPGCVSLMIHRGGDLPGKHPRLEPGNGPVRYLSFESLEEVEAARPALEGALRAWVGLVGHLPERRGFSPPVEGPSGPRSELTRWVRNT